MAAATSSGGGGGGGWLARVRFPEEGEGVYLELGPDWQWRPSDPGSAILQAMADLASIAAMDAARMGPSAGSPGVAHAHEVARRYNGKAEVPARPERGQPGVVY
jgi:hypothetical protein